MTSTLLAHSTGINAVTIRNILSALKKDGILSIQQGTGGALLACEPQQIDLYRICKAIEPDFLEKMIGIHPAPSQLCPVGRSIRTVLDHTYAKIRAGMQKQLQQITLADILADYHDAQAQERSATSKPANAHGAGNPL